jgi:GAF domain-containing protein
MIDYTHVSIYVVDGPDLTLTAYRRPIPQDHVALFNFLLAKAGGARSVIQTDAPVLIADVLTEPPIARSFLEAQKDVPEDTFSYIRCWIGYPISIGGKTSGMLDIAHTERNFFQTWISPAWKHTSKDVQATIENAILYTNLTQLSSEIQTLYTVQQAINSHLDITTVLQLVADQACQLTAARQVG